MTTPTASPGCHPPETLPLLDPAESVHWREQVHALRDRWMPRHRQAPFFTLGASSYLDAGFGLNYYGRLAERDNQLLRRYFAPLYERLAGALAGRIGRPVRFAADLAPGFGLPGFHVYLSHPAFCQPVAKVHCDRQHEPLDWSPLGGIDPDDHLSATLSIALPRRGAGLNWWALDHGTASVLPHREVRAWLERAERRYHPYRVGELVYHTGQTIHQAALMTDAQPDDERITLQAHAARPRSADYVVLYW